MGDMPKDIYIFPDSKSIGDMGFTLVLPESTLEGEPYTHYVRADTHEAELAKLRNALDVAEGAITNIAVYDDFSQYAIEETDWVQVAKDAYYFAQKALTTIKQAKEQ